MGLFNLKNLEIARKHHKPVVVMEPIKGGTLASFSEDIEQIYKNYDSSKSIASWALRFIASKEGVMTILSGMSTLEQMNDNLATMSNFVPLNNEEYKLVDQVTKQFYLNQLFHVQDVVIVHQDVL